MENSNFTAALESISWAEEAALEFDAVARDFFNRNPTEVVTSFDARTGYHIQKLRLKTALPSTLRRRATEALVNSRHAFDQAVYAAQKSCNAELKANCYFPWSRNPNDLQHLLEKRGIDRRTWPVFFAHAPFPEATTHEGGNTLIRTVATIANDKHTVGIAVQGDIGTIQFPEISSAYADSLEIMAPKWDPARNEAVLFRWRGEGIITVGQYNFVFHVLLKDKRLNRPVDMMHVLNSFTAKARAVTYDLMSACKILSG